MASQSKPPTLHSVLPESLGGSSVPPAEDAAVIIRLPYPKGAAVLPDETVHNGIRNKTLLLDNDSRVARRETYPTTSEAPTPEVGAAGIKGGSSKRTGVKPTPRATKQGRPNKNKLILPKKEQKYSIYQPLHELWLQYARLLLKDDSAMFADRVLRMDLHGAHITVVRSLDPGLVDHAGIVVAETANTLMIVTKKDRALTLPKNVTVVRLSFDDLSVEIFLPALAFRASERSARKIKKRHMAYF